MKIIHIVLNLNVGGLENLTCLMARHQMAQGHEVCICSLEAPAADKRMIAAGDITVTYLGRRQGKDVRLLFALRRFLKAARPDVVHTHNRVPLVYGALASIGMSSCALIHTRHGQELLRKSRFIWNRYDRIVPISHAAKERLMAHNHIDPAKVTVVHNGIERIEPGQTSSAGRAYPFPVIGTVSRLDPLKDIPGLIAAFSVVRARWPEAELWIIGDGPARAQLEDRARDLNIHDAVRFWGWRDDVLALNKKMDLFVLPSLSEGISIALLEAMACGLPVVATAVGGNPEVVLDGKAGLLVPSKDPKALENAIIKVLSDDTIARAMGEAGKARVEEHFSLGRMVREYQEIYEECLENKREYTRI